MDTKQIYAQRNLGVGSVHKSTRQGTAAVNLYTVCIVRRRMLPGITHVPDERRNEKEWRP